MRSQAWVTVALTLCTGVLLWNVGARSRDASPHGLEREGGARTSVAQTASPKDATSSTPARIAIQPARPQARGGDAFHGARGGRPFEPPAPPPEGLAQNATLEELRARRDELATRIDLLTRDAYHERWERDDFQIVERLTQELLTDERGRPRPAQVRVEREEMRVVFLPEDEFPLVWKLLAEQRELDARAQRLVSLRSRVRPTPF